MPPSSYESNDKIAFSVWQSVYDAVDESSRSVITALLKLKTDFPFPDELGQQTIVVVLVANPAGDDRHVDFRFPGEVIDSHG